MLSQHTQAVPGSQADAGVQAAAREADGVEYTILAALRGFDALQVEALCRDVETAYGKPAQVLARRPGETVIRYQWAMRDLQSPMLRALIRIRRSFGQVWTHVEGGRMTLYSPVAPTGAPQAVARLGAHLADLGLPVDVEAVVLPPAERAAFERMQALLAEEGFQPG